MKITNLMSGALVTPHYKIFIGPLMAFCLFYGKDSVPQVEVQKTKKNTLRIFITTEDNEKE